MHDFVYNAQIGLFVETKWLEFFLKHNLRSVFQDVKIKELEGQLSALTTSSANANREATAEVETKIRELTEKMQKQEAEFKLNLGKSAENVAQLENELAKVVFHFILFQNVLSLYSLQSFENLFFIGKKI